MIAIAAVLPDCNTIEDIAGGRLSGASLEPPQAAAVKSRGGERWGQSVEDVPQAGKDQRDERK